MATSESLESLESLFPSASSLGRFVPLLSGVPASLTTWSVPAGGFGGRPATAPVPAAVEPGTGALNMLCCRSVTSTWAAEAVLGSLNVPSSLATVLDFDFAYAIF